MRFLKESEYNIISNLYGKFIVVRHMINDFVIQVSVVILCPFIIISGIENISWNINGICFYFTVSTKNISKVTVQST